MLLFFAIPVVSADLTSLTVQGKLTNSSGDVLSGTYSLTFRIYNVTSGGSALFTQASSITTDARGIYTVELTDMGLDFDVPYYLGVTVAADSEMTPRYNLTASPYSFSASGLNATIELNQDVNFDSNTLFIDTSTNRVGIGTANPTQPLEVSGNVNVSGSSILYVPQICLNGDCQTSWPSPDGASSAGGWINTSTQTSTNLNVSINSGTLFVDTTNGKVGVGRTDPQYSFDVVGEIRSSTGIVTPAFNTNTITSFDSNTDLQLTGAGTGNVVVNDALGIFTVNPTQALDVNGSINVSGILGKLYVPEICLNGDCQTSWPNPDGVSVAGGWINDSTTTNTSLDVYLTSGNLDVNGDINATGSIDAPTICINGNCNTAWPSGGSVFINKTVQSFTGLVGANGYDSANAECNQEWTGTHLCSVQEILNTINTKNVSLIAGWTGTAWIAGGPPGYTANANDCLGFTSSSAANLGKFWDFDDTSDSGMGWMTSCSTSKVLACCGNEN